MKDLLTFNNFKCTFWEGIGEEGEMKEAVRKKDKPLFAWLKSWTNYLIFKNYLQELIY